MQNGTSPPLQAQPARRVGGPGVAPSAAKVANAAMASHPAQLQLTALATALSAYKPIAFNINLARIAGDIKAGLFLSQLLYWTRVGVHVEQNKGWVFKTREQWTLETGLSRHEQETARARLVKLKLVQEHLFGSPARLCFRIDAQALGLALCTLMHSEPIQLSLFDLRASEATVRALLGRNMAFYRILVDVLGSVTLAIFATKAMTVQRSVNEAQLERLAKSSAGKAKPGSTGSVPAPVPAPYPDWQQSWFRLSAAQWQAETGLRPGQIRVAKQELCQLQLLEESTPANLKRRLFARFDVVGLVRKITDFAGQGQGAGAGMLATLMERMGISGGNNSVGQNVPNAPKEQVGQNVRLYPRDTSGHFVPQKSTPERIDQAEAVSTKFPNPAVSIQIPRPSVPHKFSQIPRDTGVAVSSTPVGEFQHADFERDFQHGTDSSRRLSARQLASFSTPIGDFQHASRRVSAPLRAGARSLTTYQTTTTTTEQPKQPATNSLRSFSVSAQNVPGTKVPGDVVVVSSELDPRELGANIAGNGDDEIDFANPPEGMGWDVYTQSFVPVGLTGPLPSESESMFCTQEALALEQHRLGIADPVYADSSRSQQAKLLQEVNTTSLVLPVGLTGAKQADGTYARKQDVAAALHYLKSIASVERQQALLDELDGNLKTGKVKIPIAYLRALVAKDLAPGGLVLEHADGIRLEREVWAATAGQRAAVARQIDFGGSRYSPLAVVQPGILAQVPAPATQSVEELTDAQKAAKAELVAQAKAKARALLAEMKTRMPPPPPKRNLYGSRPG